MLPSGYWHVRYVGWPYAWAQWPQGRLCGPDDVRNSTRLSDEVLHDLANAANRAVAAGEVPRE